MLRHLHVLGMSIAAVLAFAAFSAPAATAANFNSEVGNTAFTTESTSNQVLSLAAGGITCSGEWWEANTKGTVFTEIVATNIAYTGCKVKTIYGSITMKVDFATNNCHYAFKATGSEVVLECEKEEGVLILGGGCTIKLPSGQHLKSVIYQNQGAGTGRYLNTEIVLSGIRSIAAGSFCSKQGESTTGQLTGSTRTLGFVDNGGVRGAQVGIWWSK